MSAATPTIVADLGGLHLYSWVYSAYFLARAVALPVFGKLADIFRIPPALYNIHQYFHTGLCSGGICPEYDAADFSPCAPGYWRRRKLCPGIHRIGRYLFTRSSAAKRCPWEALSGGWPAFWDRRLAVLS